MLGIIDAIWSACPIVGVPCNDNSSVDYTFQLILIAASFVAVLGGVFSILYRRRTARRFESPQSRRQID